MIVLALSLTWTGYVIAVAVWIVMQRRSPASTIAWLFAIAAVPVFGVLYYVLFGPRRVRRSKLRRARARARLGEAMALARDDSSTTPPEHAQQLVRLGASLGGMPLSSCTAVDLLVDGAQTYKAICAAIAAAKHHVHLEYYIFVPDATGMRVIEALIERARAGVEVRLLVDAVGSGPLRGAVLRRLRAAGVQVARFHRMRLLTLRPLLNFRTHRKIVVVDGVVGFTGGINVTVDHDESLNPHAYRDTHLRLEGLAVRWLQIVFLEDWQYANGRGPTGARYFPPVAERGEHPVQIVASGPDSDNEAIRNMYFAAIGVAEERVQVRTPYFVPDEAVLTALATAAMRGVDVRVIVPVRSDSRLVSAAARSYFDQLLRAGVRIYEYQPRMLHAKTLIVDGGFAAVGTANLDNRSFRLNFEVSAVVHGATLASELAQLFETDLLHAREVTLGARTRLPFLQRLGEAAARLLSPLL